MDKKKILAEIVGYLVRKEFTVYEVLDAYYEESERHFFKDEFFKDELLETIPSEEQKEPAETLETLETEPETKVTESATIETVSETQGTVINGDYTLKDVHKMYRGTFYENVKDFILDGKTIDEHLKENNILPVRFYDRMNSKGWTVRKAATTPINSKYDYDQIMPNGKTILQNLNRLGLGKSTFCYRVRRGYSLYEACTISEYDMRSKQTTKGVRAWKKSMEGKMKAENELREPEPELTDTVPAEESPKPTEAVTKKRSKKGTKQEPEKDKRKYTLDDDPPAKNVVASNVPDLTLVDLCQNMKISMKRLKDRIDKGTFPKPDKGNKWSYASVRFYFPN